MSGEELEEEIENMISQEPLLRKPVKGKCENCDKKVRIEDADVVKAKEEENGEWVKEGYCSNCGEEIRDEI